MQDFRHIKAWQRAHALAIALHKRTRNWQKFTAEVIEIRKMTYSYRRTMLANDAQANQKKPNS